MNSAGTSKRVVVLDGGTGTSLEKLGHNIGDETWCSGLVKTHPCDVKKVHKDFFLAGADVVLSATYQASVDGYGKQFGVSEKEAYSLLRKGVELAKEARDEAEVETGRHGFVAASVGAYGASLCDRSEYNGHYVDTMTRQKLCEWHLPRLRVLADTGPDILACETIPALEEALALLDCLGKVQLKAWLTFQLKDAQTTAHGEDIRLALKAVAECPSIVALGANCFSMVQVDSFLRYVKDLPLLDKPLIIKPNSIRDDQDGWTTEMEMHKQVVNWIDAGASWVGGCCETDDMDIARIRKALETSSKFCFKSKGEALF